MPRIREEEKPQAIIRGWKNEDLIKLNDQVDPYREWTEYKGKKFRYLSRQGMHEFLKMIGVLSMFSTSESWTVRVNGYSNVNGEYVITLNDYPHYMRGISLLDKIRINEPEPCQN